MIAPSFSLNFASGVAQPGVDVVRAGAATFVGSNGLIQPASENTQRIDWSTGAAGLLVEESRTNLLLQSRDLNTSWTKARCSVGVGETAPDGFASSRLTCNTTSVSGFFSTQTVTRSASTTYVGSVYIKKGNLDFAAITLFDGSTNFYRQYFNIASLTVGGSAATGWTGSGFVQDAGNGWVRCSITANTTTGTTLQMIVYPAQPTEGGFNCTSGDYADVYGAQIEAGAFATSYIPTTTTAVTRNADVATITGTNFSDWWQASRGGVLVRARPGTVSGTRPWVQFDDNTADNIIALRGNTTNPELYIVDGGAPQAQIDAGTIAANTDYSLTGWWATNDCKARLDSGAVVTDTSATIPTVTQARLGSDGTNYLNGHLASISYYDSFSEQIYTRRKNKAVFNLM